MSHFLPKDVHAFSDHLSALGKANGTVNRYLATISSVFNHAVDEQIITHAPKLKFLPEEEGRIRYFSKEEQKNVIAYLESLDLSKEMQTTQDNLLQDSLIENTFAIDDELASAHE